MNKAKALKVVVTVLPFAAAGVSVAVGVLHGVPPIVALSNWWGGGGFWPKMM